MHHFSLFGRCRCLSRKVHIVCRWYKVQQTFDRSACTMSFQESGVRPGARVGPLSRFPACPYFFRFLKNAANADDLSCLFRFAVLLFRLAMLHVLTKQTNDLPAQKRLLMSFPRFRDHGTTTSQAKYCMNIFQVSLPTACFLSAERQSSPNCYY